MPLGRLNWRVDHLGEEVDSCKEKADIEMRLAFSSCTDGQFTCDSGDCVDKIRYLLTLTALGSFWNDLICLSNVNISASSTYRLFIFVYLAKSAIITMIVKMNQMKCTAIMLRQKPPTTKTWHHGIRLTIQSRLSFISTFKSLSCDQLTHNN